MVQLFVEVAIVGLLTLVIGIIWMIVQKIVGADHDPGHNRQEGSSQR